MAWLWAVGAVIASVMRRGAGALAGPRLPVGRKHGLLALSSALAALAVTGATSSFALPAPDASSKAPVSGPAPSTGVPAGTKPAGERLVKTGKDVVTGSTTTANPGDAIQWTVSYTNPDGSPTSTSITDVIQGGPGSTPQTQTFVPGSLKVPPGFTAQWSTDGGSSFGTEDAGRATNAVRAVNPQAPSPATAQAAVLPPPFNPVTQQTGGDGWVPILHTATVNGVETPQIWNIYHEAHSADGAAVVCTEVRTSKGCTSPTGEARTWPQAMNSSVAEALKGDLRTNFSPTYVQSGSKLYYPAYLGRSPSPIGVGCLDLQAQQSCGFTALTTANAVIGVVQAPNGKIYAASGTGAVLCFDPGAGAACGTFDIGLPTVMRGGLTVVDDRVFVTAGGAVGCFDSARGAVCEGWTSPRSGPAALGIYPHHDADGKKTGVCVTDSSSVDVACWDIQGSAIADPPGLQTLLSMNGRALAAAPLTFQAPNGHTQSLFPSWAQGGTAYCYDWTTRSPCAGFGNIGPGAANFPSIGNGNNMLYGFAYDEQCSYALGHMGYLFSIDPVTGSTPCLRVAAKMKVDPSQSYCDGQDGHVKSYSKVSLGGIDPKTVRFADSSVAVKDSSGKTLGTFPFDPASRTADISSIPTTVGPITVTTRVALETTSSFTETNQPQVIVSWDGDAPQMCFRTEPVSDCAVTSVHNQATLVTGSLAPVASNRVSFHVAPSEGCLPKAEVVKEVCTSTDKAACGKDGAGPWASSTTVPWGGTAYWRITVTNTGPVAITGATLNDQQEASCVKAAGAFDLAVGKSTHFFCSTSKITKDTTNTVTASFVPADSLPGTKPITTAPSSATAKSTPNPSPSPTGDPGSTGGGGNHQPDNDPPGNNGALARTGTTIGLCLLVAAALLGGGLLVRTAARRSRSTG
ncbi:hypothetical protein [Streptomyces sp. NBC_00057]|uniref:DUF7617 domain-containing protein n=1 Tax=Streptomyces sp. NBC_00057 TaxID=2975634 RepID=UPI00324E8BB3